MLNLLASMAGLLLLLESYVLTMERSNMGSALPVTWTTFPAAKKTPIG